MSMLDRYRKPGGFIQLLHLMETFGAAKQEKFLHLIREEDPAWGKALESKIITIQRIFSWPAEVVSEIAGNLQQLTLATSLHALTPDQAEILCRTFSHFERRRLEEMRDSSRPTGPEIESALIKIIGEARKMIEENRLRLEEHDADVLIEEGIEERIKAGGGGDRISVDAATTVGEIKTDDSSATSLSGLPQTQSPELKKKLAAALAENNALKLEVSRLRAKMEQIRKAVA